MLQTMVVENI